jgi:FHA domain-containing protein
MREFLRLAGTFIAADQTPFYQNKWIIIGAALVVALIILVAALLLFRSSGKKKKANAAASSDWQRQGQQGMPGGWNQPGTPMPATNPWGQQGQQPNAWGAQQQPGGWDAQSPAPQQQVPGWGAQSPAPQQPAPGWGAQQSPIPQQPAAGWGAQSPAPQQQAGAWGAQSPAPQQPAGWGNQGQGSMGGQQPWDAPASSDPWAQQQQGASPWGQQGNQPAPTTYGSGSGSGQSWAQPAQVADQWGQPVQQAQQGAWSPGFQQPPPSTPPAGNAPWQQQGFVQGQGQQGFGVSPFESPDADRTMLRGTGGSQGIGMVRIEEGKEPGRVYEVRKESLSIGRSRESDIFLEDLAVSRLHASIISLGNNNYALRDEGSANGTKVNGQPVNKYQPYPLQEGDKIQLGQTVLVFAKH